MSITTSQAESAKKFLARMASDADFFLTVGQAKSKEERWDVIHREGFYFSAEDLSVASKELGPDKMKSFETTSGFLPGTAAMGDIPRQISNDGCGTCE